MFDEQGSKLKVTVYVLYHNGIGGHGHIIILVDMDILSYFSIQPSNKGQQHYTILWVKLICMFVLWTLCIIHTLRVHYAHAVANLNSGYSKYAKVARVHYFCTIALWTSRAVLTRAWASHRVDLFSKRVIIFCW